jgi:uncharacterized repeat protein (TIGR02543 family)
VTLTATPAPNWVFDHWSGALTGTNSTDNITMDGDKTVTATFKHSTYTLTVTTDGNGTVTQSPALPYYQGDDTIVTLTATPLEGWTFDHWSGALSGSTNPATITMDSNKTVTATFIEIEEEHVFQSFVISQMTIDWAKDTNNKDKKWPWGSWFSWFDRLRHKNEDTFSISGRLTLPKGYTMADLKESATVTVTIADSSVSDTVGFKELNLKKAGVMWQYKGREQSSGEGMNITKMTIWWAPQTDEWGGWAGFNIAGEFEFPESIGVNTKPAEATVVLEIPISAEKGSGSLAGEETVKFKVPGKSNQWYYLRLKLPPFHYEP